MELRIVNRTIYVELWIKMFGKIPLRMQNECKMGRRMEQFMDMCFKELKIVRKSQ